MDNQLVFQWEEKMKEVNKGTRIKHTVFGAGTVVEKSSSVYDEPLKKDEVPLLVSAQLTVLFDCEQYPRTFAIPMAFVEGLLTLEE